MSDQRSMEEKFYRVIKRLRCMGNPIRLQICRHLVEQEELSVKELAEAIGASANNISQHLGSCRDLDLVRYRHEGKFVY